MKSIKVCEYSRSRSFHYDLILQIRLQVSVLRTNGPLVFSVTVQAGLCWTWSETQSAGYHMQGLTFLVPISGRAPGPGEQEEI